ncbi:MAG TPA: carboxypeptidase regulatory-like domain-containing protein, partial [Planctomycetota bacterium]|nr:carboxypeptidase regulatory-like domain-containing protein [Planctomycetota bacterium]
RIVLNLRLLHGLSPTEIARATEAPLETVRTRLKRGTEILRQRLPASFVGLIGACALSERGLAAVRSAVLADAAATTAAVSASAIAIVGGSMVTKAALGFGVALVAAAVFWLGWPSGETSLLPADPASTLALRPLPVLPAGPEAVTTPSDRTHVDERNDVKEALASAPTPESCGVRGRLLTAAGGPAAQCEVRAVSFDPAELFGETLADLRGDAAHFEHATHASADGRFEILGLDSRSSLVLLADSAAGVTTVFRAECELRSGTVADIGELVLREGATLIGRVVADGLPVAGARVRVAPDLPVSLELGYRSSCLRRDLLVPESVVHWNAHDELTIVEPPAWTGSLWRSLGAPETVSDPEGRFRLSGVDAGSRFVWASKLGRSPAVVTPDVELGATLDLGDLELAAGETARGTVTDSEGAPLADAEVLVGPRSLAGASVHLLQRAGRTDSEGRFAIGGQAPREVYVAVRARGAATFTASGPHAIGDAIVIREPRRFDLSVEVMRGGARAQDVRITVRAGRARGELAALTTPVRTIDLRAGESRTKVAGLLEGNYDVRAGARDALEVCAEIDLDQDRALVLQLEPARGVDIRVVDAEGDPVANARLFARNPESLEWTKSVVPADAGFAHWDHLPVASAITDARGAARLTGLPKESFTLVTSHPSFSASSQSVPASDGEATVRLAPLGGIDLSVLHDGRPTDRARSLELVALDAEQRGGLPIASRHATTDAHGTCKLRGLSAGRWRVLVFPFADAALRASDSFLFASFDGPLLFPREAAEAEIVVLSDEIAILAIEESANHNQPGEPTLAVHGRVQLNGLPAGGLAVKAVNFEKMVGGRFQMLRAEVERDGAYRIEGLALPRASMKITLELESSGDGMLVHDEVAVQPGSSDVQHDFDVIVGELHGVVRDRAGAPVPDCNVIVNGRDRFGLDVECRTDARGRYAFAHVPLGRISLQALNSRGNTTHDAFAVEVGENELDVTLLEYCRVAGVVALSRIQVPATAPIDVVLEMVDGPVNYLPRGTVERASGKFEIQKVMAGAYRVRVFSEGAWWKHCEIVHVLPGEAESLAIVAEPDAGPTQQAPLPASIEPGVSAAAGGF